MIAKLRNTQINKLIMLSDIKELRFLTVAKGNKIKYVTKIPTIIYPILLFPNHLVIFSSSVYCSITYGTEVLIKTIYEKAAPI